jgi:hypothetical protein
MSARLRWWQIFHRLTRLEKRMSAVDDVIVKLDEATDEIAADLAKLRDEVAGGDTAVAARFQPLVDRLTALGKDPELGQPEQAGGSDFAPR